MAQIQINRTELVWPGKYDERGERVAPKRAPLPFQTIETINESRATREAKKRPTQTTLFDVWTGDEGETFEEGWRNKLIWGNNFLVMSSLLEKFAGKVDLIYIDPPFATGADFSVRAPIGEFDDEVYKEQSLIEEKAYRDTWGRGTASYLSMLQDRLELMRELLKPNGSIYVHCDYRVDFAIRALLDEIFGSANFVNQIVWHYKSFHGQTKAYFPRKHDVIFFYGRSDEERYFVLPRKEVALEEMIDFKNWGKYIVNGDEIRGGYYPSDVRFKRNLDKWLRNNPSRTPGADDVLYKFQSQPEDDTWDIPYLDPKDKKERVDYPTQKPEKLVERIIRASSLEGGLVADFFVGSGTTAAVAEKLGRRWIACDLGRFAIHTTRKRLMGIEGCKPFEVLNLGQYERQYWQAASFGGRDADRVLLEYIAFLLRLYGAEPLPGLQHLHGKRGGAVVHIGAVDAPVTIAEVSDALDECVVTGQRELHVLGWEWEMGLNDLVDQLAQERRVRLKLLAIPREVMEAQAVDEGDIRFFELAHLECAIETGPDCALTIALTDFAMSNADAIDDEVRAKITKWSDFVDYWAADFDFRNDTFMNGWVAYRTRKNRRLTLRSDTHRYSEGGTYRVAVKVVDIFGNDTTKVYPVEVK